MHRKLLCAGIGAATLLLTGPVRAQSAFDGTWKADLTKAHLPTKPQIFLLKDGTYTCKTCVPPITVAADGISHPVVGQPYFDSVLVKVVSPAEIQEIDMKAGKKVAEATVVVAPGGKTAVVTFSDSSNTNAAPVTGKQDVVQVAAGPAGSHAISGSWKVTKVEGISDNAVTTTFKTTGDMFSMTTPTGQSYTAKLDGSEAPAKGDIGWDSVTVKKTGADTIVETDKRAGKVIGVMKATVAADGTTMKVTYMDKLHGTSMTYVAMKQ